MTPYYDEDGITIYHADCADVLPALGDDLVVLTDPPYGIDLGAHRASQGGALHDLDPTDIAGDDTVEGYEVLFGWLPADMPAAIFGAQNAPHLLPHVGRWACWDKRLSREADKMLGSAFELAWLNRTSGYNSMFRCLHGGVVNANGHSLKRLHPTEKPVPLLREMILQLFPEDLIIVDPFMGSGTTLRAAKDLGRRAIGIEIEEKYCEIAVERLAQGVLF